MLTKLPNENNQEWKFRLIEEKLTGAINDDWQDIVEALNLNVHRDTLRKGSIFFLEIKEYFEKKFKDGMSNEQLDEMKQLEKELFKLKVQLSDERREIRKYMTHEARLDNLLNKLLDEIKDDMYNNKPLRWVKPLPSTSSKGALTLLLSDLHKGMVTDNYWNKYNDEIFYERLNQVRYEVLEYKELLNVKEIHVFELGDVISGCIHRLTKLSETENAVTSTQKVAEALSELVSVLANNFETVHYYNVKGNHDRVAARKEEEVRTESFHSFIMWYIEMRLEKFENVIFHKNDIDSEIIVAEILGNKYYGVHGHLDSVNTVINNLSLMLDKKPKAIFAGHIHKNFENEVHGVDLIVNGSFGGVDDYAKDGRMTGKAHQKLLWITEKGRKGTFFIEFN